MIRDLVDAVYGDDPDGGPLYASECIRTHIHQMKPALAAVGLRIASRPYHVIEVDIIAEAAE